VRSNMVRGVTCVNIFFIVLQGSFSADTFSIGEISAYLCLD